MFSKWIIFIVLFAFAESSPETTPPPEEHDITETVNNIISNIFRSFEWNSAYAHVRNNTNNNYTSKMYSHDVQFRNGIQFYNITTKFQPSPNLKIRLKFYDSIIASCEMMSVSLKGYVKNSSNFIATEIIPFNFTLYLPMLQSRDDGKKPVIVDYHNFDQYNITLLTNGYKYQPSEENEIKQEFKTYLKTILDDKVNQEWKVSLIFLGYMFLRGLGQKSTITANHADFSKNEQSHYYFVDSIPSNSYTLSNVTIKGLWNFRSVTLDFANPAAFPELLISDVTGTAELNLPTDEEPWKLSFKLDTIYTSANQEAGTVNLKAEGYSVKNTKTNTLLTDNQSRAIVEKIESTVAGMIAVAMKNFKF